MKVQLLILGLVFTGIVSCHSQEVNTGKKVHGKNKPHEEIQVNRKYDDKGNLIEFDSTYSSYYSTYVGDTLDIDSVLQHFQMYFNHNMSGMDPNIYFGEDSTFLPGFFHNDFFEQQFFHQDEMLLRMMREMDSIKNEFFKMHSEQ
jgi:hypothetical protein